jgi:hypothetical protein
MTDIGNAAALPAAIRRTSSGVNAIGFGRTLGSLLKLRFDMALDLLCDRLGNRYQGVGKGKARQGVGQGMARPGGGSGRVGLPLATSLVSAGFSSIGRGKALRPISVSRFNIAGDRRAAYSLVVVLPLPPGTCP